MKSLIPIVLILINSSCVVAHDSNEGIPSIKQGSGWFGRRRLPKTDNNDKDDLVKTNAMHSFTGVEGIDHHTKDIPTHEDLSKRATVEVKEVKEIKEEENINGELLSSFMLASNFS